MIATLVVVVVLVITFVVLAAIRPVSHVEAPTCRFCGSNPVPSDGDSCGDYGCRLEADLPEHDRDVYKVDEEAEVVYRDYMSPLWAGLDDEIDPWDMPLQQGMHISNRSVHTISRWKLAEDANGWDVIVQESIPVQRRCVKHGDSKPRAKK